MRGYVRSIFQDLAGGRQKVFSGLLVEQIDATIEAARLVDSVVTGRMPVGPARVEMSRVEHAGDDKRAELITELSRSLTTPIDREDLFRLSRSVDDVLDNLRDFLREAELFEPVSLELFAPVLVPVTKALVFLRRASSGLTKLTPEVSDLSLSARKASSAVRREYEIMLAGLFSSATSPEILKQRELGRRLDVVGLRIAEAANALADGCMKRAGMSVVGNEVNGAR